MDERSAARLAAKADLITPMVIRVAASLRVADHVAAGVRDVASLAAATGADPDALGRVLAHLVAAGVFGRDEQGGVTLGPLGDALREDDPAGLRRRYDIDGALGRADLSFVELLDVVRTGAAAYPLRYGAHFWEDVGADPERSAGYDALMAADVTGWAPAIIGAYAWGALDRVVDVGGGDGALLVELLRAFPQLRGTVFDQPATVARARARFDAEGFVDRAAAVAGDFFTEVPPGAPAYLLTAIVHDWDDEPASAILANCATAASVGDGRVFVIEKIGSDGQTPNPYMDLMLLAFMRGRERSLRDLIALCESAGLEHVATRRAGAIVILELLPRSSTARGHRRSGAG